MYAAVLTPGMAGRESRLVYRFARVRTRHKKTNPRRRELRLEAACDAGSRHWTAPVPRRISSLSTRLHTMTGAGQGRAKGPRDPSKALKRLIYPRVYTTAGCSNKWCSLGCISFLPSDGALSQRTFMRKYLLPVEPPELAYAVELVLVQRVVVFRQDSHAAIFLHENAWSVGFDRNGREIVWITMASGQRYGVLPTWRICVSVSPTAMETACLWHCLELALQEKYEGNHLYRARPKSLLSRNHFSPPDSPANPRAEQANAD